MADTFSIRLPDDLRAEVDRIAAHNKRSRAFIIKEAVEAYIEDRRTYHTAVEAALAEADKGVFVSAANVQTWIEALVNDPNALPPEPDVFKHAADRSS